MTNFCVQSISLNDGFPKSVPTLPKRQKVDIPMTEVDTIEPVQTPLPPEGICTKIVEDVTHITNTMDVDMEIDTEKSLPAEAAVAEQMSEPMVDSPTSSNMTDTTDTDELARLENMLDKLSNLVSLICCSCVVMSNC